MKTTMKLIAAATLLLCATAAHAGTQIFFGNLVSVPADTQSNSPAISIGVQPQPNGTVMIQHGTLATTNDIQVKLQLSLDNTNFVTVATWNPTVLTATTETWIPAYTMPPIYMRGSCTNTTAGPISVGGVFTQ